MRLSFILLGLCVLAVVSTVFGMMMAVASDLPRLENKAEFKAAENSVVYASPTSKGADGEELAQLTGNNNRILVESSEISPNIKHAVIAIEDRRFYEHDGAGLQGDRPRAVPGRARTQRRAGRLDHHPAVREERPGGSGRPVRVPEAARVRPGLPPRTSVEQGEGATQYLNSVYFGNGAMAWRLRCRTYYGSDDPDDTAPATLEPGTVADGEDSDDDLNANFAKEASPAEAALLAGMIASPSLYDPLQNPVQATERRNDVLQRMLEQQLITETEYQDAINQSVPTDNEVDPPQPDSRQPYFTSWLTQQLVDRYNAPAVFSGGLEVQTTLDPELQYAGAGDRRSAGGRGAQRLSGGDREQDR